jgi:hypothetical protein
MGRNNMNQAASRPIRSAVVAGMAIAVPVLLCWAHRQLFGIWHPYSFVVAAGIIGAVILVKNERLRSMNTRELLAPLVGIGKRRTRAIVVVAAIEVVALALGGMRLFQRHALLGKVQGVDPCLAETTDPQAAADLDLGPQRDESVALCRSRRETEAKKVAAKQCDELVSSLSNSDGSLLSRATGVAEPERSVLSRTAEGALTAADLGVASMAFYACGGRFWPIYVKGAANAARAWRDISSGADVTDELTKELVGGKQKMSAEAATALSANAEARALKAPPAGASDVYASVNTFCLFAESVTHTARGPACTGVAKKVDRAKAIEGAKTKADAAREEAKQKADDAREQAHAAAAERCRKGCDGLMPSSANDPDDRWDRCMERCTGMDKLNAPLPF